MSEHGRTLFDRRMEHDACGVGFVACTRGASHEVLRTGLDALCRLSHRGGVAADGETGDGAGVLTQVPRELFLAEWGRLGGAGRPQAIGVGAFFLPTAAVERASARRAIHRALAAEGLIDRVWRPVPVNVGVLGSLGRAGCPAIEHLLVARPAGLDAAAFERRLYRVRRRAEEGFAALREAVRDCYAVSFSARTVVYKGLMRASRLAAFYPDLADPRFRTAGVVYHQRYSTNTAPGWRRAQPFRRLAHNGEINTLQGNVHWMRAREADLRAPCWSGLDELLRPVLDPETSDSGMLDNVVELLHLSGRDLRHVMMMVVPEAWEQIPDLPPALRDFHRYHACLTEPWEGPAALAFADGRLFGAALDRNGLRPMRYVVTDDGWVAAGSEAGVVDADAGRVVRHGKLGPGQILCVDLETGRVMEDEAVKNEICARRPYGAWAAAGLRVCAVSRESGAPAPLIPDNNRLQRLERAFAYTHEEIVHVLRPMVEHGQEAVGSMGDDTPHAVLSAKERPLFHYFKQRFAEVTNPPIDHLREGLVFSLRTRLGPRGNLLAESPGQARLLELPGPVLLDAELADIRRIGEAEPAFRCATLEAVFARGAGAEGLRPALARLGRAAEEAVASGAGILVVSDRGVDAERVAVPALMAVGAVHHHLIRAGLRMRASIVAETGEPREVHHLAALIGFGANAVNPYVALAALGALAVSGRLKGVAGAGEAQAAYRRAAEDGLKKVMSKMGISTVEGYAGAQAFEAVGVGREVTDLCFPGAVSRLGGNGFTEFGALMLGWHAAAFPKVSGPSALTGFYRFRPGGEVHEFSPEAVDAMHRAVRAGVVGPEGEAPPEIRELYRRYVKAVERSGVSQLRHLLGFCPERGRGPARLREVEPVSAIVRRFSSGAMSLGSLSPEAHETLAMAMNRLGARSASGEGGEDPARFGGERCSAIKQVASGRFGVTPAYLASAVELQIKMAQGSKPGEGGQIPGQKVTGYIARIRRTTPGVALISPPPHHDIYSIEDLAQLISDLKRLHPRAEVSVKLVAQSGVGIIAAGVVKGGADIVLISGHAGGTGSSPLTSIKNAGLPWEMGLAETQQALMANGLRGRVVLRVDGGLRIGRDVVVAAMLGADQYSFGTAAMIAEGCIMARVCHTDNCPVGVTSQKEALRRKFPGRPEQVMNFFRLLAQEVREILAGLGCRSLDEVVGRVDLLRQVRTGQAAADRLDLGPLLAVAGGDAGAGAEVRAETARRHLAGGERSRRAEEGEDATPRDAQMGMPLLVAPGGVEEPRAETKVWPGGSGAWPHRRRGALSAAVVAPETDGTDLRGEAEGPGAPAPPDSADERLLRAARLALDSGEPARLRLTIGNDDRTVGARLAYEVARRYGDGGLPPDAVQAEFWGVAGQSFGAFLPSGIVFELTGAANDGVGKGLAGGEIVVRPHPGLRGPSCEHVLLGNAALYGATGGLLLAAGRAGERFAVRNSGATAVVEGVGMHGCEYMTGGTAVVLGPVGHNFGAGMTGGVAFVLDLDPRRLNGDLVEAAPMPAGESQPLHSLLEAYAARTGSARAAALCGTWPASLPRFSRVAPRGAVRAIAAHQEGGRAAD